MNRRITPWLLCLPLMLGGTEFAHWLAFRIVYPDPWMRAQVLQESGHRYLGWLPSAAGIGLALVVCGLFLHGRATRSGMDGAIGRCEPALWRFAMLPPLAFALQEHLESLVAHGTIAGVTLEPTFTVGLALQLPFAALAYVLARLLLGASERVSRAFRRSEPPVSRRVADVLLSWFSLVLAPPQVPALSSGRPVRGPPRR